MPRPKTPPSTEIPPLLKAGTWEVPKPNETSSTSVVPTPSTATNSKYPSQLMIPFSRLYSHPPQTTNGTTESSSSSTTTTTNNHQITQSRDPRLLKKKTEMAGMSSDTIPLSPQHFLHERSISDSALTIKPSSISAEDALTSSKSSSSPMKIPLSSAIPLPDPRTVSLTPTRTVLFFDSQAVKHYFQQQKRSNHHHDSKSGSTVKTNYTPISYQVRQVSLEEYEQISANEPSSTEKIIKTSRAIDYASLYVSVVDCFTFAFSKTTSTNNQIYIDLEKPENKLAYDQMEKASELIERERQLNSQQIRLRLREKRQRKMQQYLTEKRIEQTKSSNHGTISPCSISKSHLSAGRQMLKEYPMVSATANSQVPSDLLDFFAREYRHETRSHVKHLLAELVGIFIEKYHLEPPRRRSSSIVQEQSSSTAVPGNHEFQPMLRCPSRSFSLASIIEDKTNNSVVDMDLDSQSPHGLGDHDERFRLSTPSPPPALFNTSLLSVSVAPNPVENHLTLLRIPPPTFTQPFKETDLSIDLGSASVSIPNAQDFSHPNDNTSTIHVPVIPTKVESISPPERIPHEPPLQPPSPPPPDHPPIDEETPIGSNEETDRSRDEFVRLLTEKIYVSQSPSPSRVSSNMAESLVSREQQEQSFEETEHRLSPPLIKHTIDHSSR